MKKKQFTEEELAAYIDGTLPEFRMHDLESSLTDDTLELIGVTRAALGMVAEDGVEPEALVSCHHRELECSHRHGRVPGR